MKTIENFLNHLNTGKWKDQGSFSLRDDKVKDLREMYSEKIKGGDKVIEYSYWDDGLSRNEIDEMIDWLYERPDSGWGLVRDRMKKMGYEEVTDIDMDGSGNGLYYGIVVFRRG